MQITNFNINDHVEVRLTDHGRRILHRLGRTSDSAHDGWDRFQLWSLMSIFGPYVHPGAFRPFTDIHLLNPNPCSSVSIR